LIGRLHQTVLDGAGAHFVERDPAAVVDDFDDDLIAFVIGVELQDAGPWFAVGGPNVGLFDAVIDACKDTMAAQQGRKALIILSDGGENGSEASLQQAIDAAHRSDTLIYSILFGGTEGRSILQRMSKETGGGFLEPTKKFTIDQVFDVIQDELRGQYNIGYISDVPVRISEFRKLQLTTTRKGLTVQARDKYWAQR